MRKLQSAFQRTLKYSMRGVPHDEFVAYFPEGPLSDAVLNSAFDGYRQVRYDVHVCMQIHHSPAHRPVDIYSLPLSLSFV